MRPPLHCDPAWLRNSARYWNSRLQADPRDDAARRGLEQIQRLAVKASVRLPAELPPPRRLPAESAAGFLVATSDLATVGLAVAWREDLRALLELEQLVRTTLRTEEHPEVHAVLLRLDEARARESSAASILENLVDLEREETAGDGPA